MPATAVEGIAPGVAVSGERSVDIDIQAPTAGACPQTWTVGARLTPVHGQTSGFVDLQPAPADTWTPVTGAELTLPEAGVYEIIADVHAGMILSGSVVNAYIQARVFDTTAGTVVPYAQRTPVFLAVTPADGMVHTIHGDASVAALYQAGGPATIRVEALKHVDSGTVTSETVWAMNLRFKKVAD